MRYSLLAVLVTSAFVLGCSNSDGSTVETSRGVSVSFNSDTGLSDTNAVEDYLYGLDDDLHLIAAGWTFYATWSSSEDEPCTEVVANLKARTYVREVECQEADRPKPTEPASERIQQSQFLIPFTQAREAGLTPYWLGEEFSAGDKVFLVNNQTGFLNNTQGGPSMLIFYTARRGDLTLQTLAETASQDDELRSGFAGEAAVTQERVVVGRWQADLYTLSAGSTPVSERVLFIDMGGTTVVATTHGRYGSSPDDNPNPLIDLQALIDTLEQLRPYPE
jgi:hypothetical protein